MADSKRGRHWSHWLFWALMFELVYVGGFAERSRVEGVLKAEWTEIQDSLPESAANWVFDNGQADYNALFVDTGIRKIVNDALVLSEESKKASGAMAKLGQSWFFPWLREREWVVFSMLRELVVRFATLMVWWPFFCAVLLPAGWDGMCEWRRRQFTFHYASSTMHAIGVRMLVTMPVIMAFVFIAPIPLTPWIYPLLAVTIAIGMVLIAKHTQKRV
jgi:hypothetical protein